MFSGPASKSLELSPDATIAGQVDIKGEVLDWDISYDDAYEAETTHGQEATDHIPRLPNHRIVLRLRPSSGTGKTNTLVFLSVPGTKRAFDFKHEDDSTNNKGNHVAGIGYIRRGRLPFPSNRSVIGDAEIIMAGTPWTFDDDTS